MTPDHATGNPSHVVAVINTSPDTIDILKDLFERAGFVVATTFTHDIRDGKIDLEAFLRVHRPDVIVYDIAPPYEANWRFLQHLRQTTLAGYRFVLTTTNPGRVEPLVGRDDRVYEIVDKQGDLDSILRATREAMRSRSTSNEHRTGVH
jgi:CheY-like chemotaxis protein